jgi:hypothetical protein
MVKIAIGVDWKNVVHALDCLWKIFTGMAAVWECDSIGQNLRITGGSSKI